MIAVITPVFNDWISFARLVEDLDGIASELPEPIELIAVDDGSTLPMPLLTFVPSHLRSVEVLTLHCNLGHQRALAVGLSEAVRRDRYSSVVMMDSDGEDAPLEIPRLFKERGTQGVSIVVARRTWRTEGALFRTLYAFYKMLFRLLTGRVIDFGNFCLLPASAARRLVYMADSWNHLAATALKSRHPIIQVGVQRTKRYAGHSTMSLVGLVVHGFSAISVFSETVLTRLFLILAIVAMGAVTSGFATVFIRLLTDKAIPGWATNAFGFSFIIFTQVLTLVSVLVFITLNNRAGSSFIPATQSLFFIANKNMLFANTEK